MPRSRSGLSSRSPRHGDSGITVSYVIFHTTYRWQTKMPRPIEARGLIFSLRHAPCAHICRYCLVSETRKGSKLPFARFEQLVHRFYDWKASGRTDIDIRTFIGPSLDYDLDVL